MLFQSFFKVVLTFHWVFLRILGLYLNENVKDNDVKKLNFLFWAVLRPIEVLLRPKNLLWVFFFFLEMKGFSIDFTWESCRMWNVVLIVWSPKDRRILWKTRRIFCVFSFRIQILRYFNFNFIRLFWGF